MDGIQALVEAARKLAFNARTSGGVAGRDDELCKSIDAVEDALIAFEACDHCDQAKGEILGCLNPYAEGLSSTLCGSDLLQRLLHALVAGGEADNMIVKCVSRFQSDSYWNVAFDLKCNSGHFDVRDKPPAPHSQNRRREMADLRKAAQAFLDAWEKWRCRLPDTRDVYRVDDAAYALKDVLAVPPSPAMEEYDHELALMLWPFVNAKELSEDKFAKVARKSFAAFTRDHHRSCMAAWKVYCGKRQSRAYRRTQSQGGEE